jgi:hypothetical protein
MENQVQRSKSPAERRSYWRSQLLQWSQSGLTQKQFCQERGLSTDMFAWWKARLRDELNLSYRAAKTSLTKKHKQHFVEVRVSRHIPTLSYEVVLTNSRCIRVSERFDPDVLKKLITTVESVC